MNINNIIFKYNILDNNANTDKIDHRPPYTFKSGAVYEGEWRGNMREGYGV